MCALPAGKTDETFSDNQFAVSSFHSIPVYSSLRLFHSTFLLSQFLFRHRRHSTLRLQTVKTYKNRSEFWKFGKFRTFNLSVIAENYKNCENEVSKNWTLRAILGRENVT